jgi:hypothetical protein
MTFLNLAGETKKPRESQYGVSQQRSIYVYIYLTAIVLTPGGSSTIHIYTRTKQNTKNGAYITIIKLNIHC